MQKKKTLLFSVLIIMVFICIIVWYHDSKQLFLKIDDENGEPIIEIKSNMKQEEIKIWKADDSQYFFFLPSCAQDRIYFKLSDNYELTCNEIPVHNGESFEWSKEEKWNLKVKDHSNGEEMSYDILFMKSENISSMFLSTASGSMEKILQDKNFFESGSMLFITEEGNIEYSGEVEKISGRGNSTWTNYPKKSYAIKLKKSSSLCGMKASKGWNLLALWREGTKLNTKIAMDIARKLNLEYTPDMTWVDVYINGEYAGIYLLGQKVAIEDGNADIIDLEKESVEELTGRCIEIDGTKGYQIAEKQNINENIGYLIEKDYSVYFKEEKCGFITEQGYCFSVKSPEYASIEQVKYIENYIQEIENLILNQEENYIDFVDVDSFSKKFLVDEIALNFDTGITSMYYYKKRNDDLLYAGPVWDYDTSFGNVNSEWNGGGWINWEESIVNSIRPDGETLNWNKILYNNKYFYESILQSYQSILPFLEEIVETKIDDYTSYIYHSVKMDSVRWNGVEPADGAITGHYSLYDNNVRYFKYFLANRINYLNKRWGISYKDFNVYDLKENHKVTFWSNGKIVDTIYIKDGDRIVDYPKVNDGNITSWKMGIYKELYDSKLPVYEDISLYAELVRN